MRNEKSNTGLSYPKIEFPNVFSGFDLSMDPQLKLQMLQICSQGDGDASEVATH